MAEVKELTIPLRAAWKVPRTNRAKRAMAEVRIHVSRHMKKTDEEEIWIDESVNHAIWARGMQNPPRKIRVVCTREEGTGGLKWAISDLHSSYRGRLDW